MKVIEDEAQARWLLATKRVKEFAETEVSALGLIKASHKDLLNSLTTHAKMPVDLQAHLVNNLVKAIEITVQKPTARRTQAVKKD